MAVSRGFWSKNLKPVVISLKLGVFGGVEAEGLKSTKTPGFNEYHHRFSSSYLQKHVNTAIFRPSFTEYRQQKIKKYGRVSTETVI